MPGKARADPSGLFNASLDAGTRRALDIREGEKIDEKAFKALIRAAVALGALNRWGPAPPELTPWRVPWWRCRP